MESPPLILVQPIPLGVDPSSSSESTSASSVPELTRSTIEQERTSSETATIFTIYSMYGDEPLSVDEPNGKAAANLSLASDSSYRSSLLQSTRCSTSDLAHYDSRTTSRRSTVTDLNRSSATSNRSARFLYGGARPSSSYALAPTHNGIEHPTDSRTSINQKRRHSVAPSSYLNPQPSGTSSPPRPRPTSSRPRSSHKSLDLHRDELQPPPPPTPPPTSSTSRPASTPPFLPQATDPPIPPHKAIPRTGSPSSKTSIVQSDGEDVDAFHVRSTYAQLEIYGVKGDGYEEGVERTRARVGASRASAIRADEAMGDGNEKIRDLSPKEIETLSSLDRYGFFSIPSHDRLIILSMAPLTKRLTHVSAGPSSAPSNATSLESLPSPPHPVKEASRIAKWDRMLEPRVRDEGANVEEWGIKRSKEQKLRERTYKGIPDRWRSAAWQVLMNRFSKSGGKELLKLGLDYREVLDKPSTYDVQIDLDVPRTISGHIMFRTRYGAGQRSLFHVLHSFSLLCPHCGYVQGMGPIAATLLCYFEPERVYASLVRLHDAYGMHTIFSPGFPGLLEAIYVQERITEQMMPDVYAAFKNHMISTTSYATKWYITLFANSVPFQTQLRLWDVFLLEGQDVFVAVAVAIVWVYRDHITSGSANFETVLSLLSSFFVPEDENVFLAWIGKMLGDKKIRGNMVRWRDHWKELVAKGEDGAALL